MGPQRPLIKKSGRPLGRIGALEIKEALGMARAGHRDRPSPSLGLALILPVTRGSPRGPWAKPETYARTSSPPELKANSPDSVPSLGQAALLSDLFDLNFWLVTVTFA
jgi:hypothetical protein